MWPLVDIRNAWPSEVPPSPVPVQSDWAEVTQARLMGAMPVLGSLGELAAASGLEAAAGISHGRLKWAH